MLRDGGNDWLRRGIADFGIAMALFWTVAFFVNGDHSRAHAVAAPRIGEETILNAAITAPASWQGAVDGRAVSGSRSSDVDQRQALALLSVAFAAIIASNLAFWRHLRRVYASPRRSVWRRGR
jgi:hypothetical protein